MPAYVIVEVETHDRTLMEEYRTYVAPTVQAYGGRFLVRGGACETLEGGWSPERIVVIEFPTVAAAKAWWGRRSTTGRKRCASAPARRA